MKRIALVFALGLCVHHRHAAVTIIAHTDQAIADCGTGGC
jgi:hypothetical protein